MKSSELNSKTVKDINYAKEGDNHIFTPVFPEIDLPRIKDVTFIKQLGDCEFSYLLRSMGYEIKERSILIEIETSTILIKFNTKPNQSLQDAFIDELKRILLSFMGESKSVTECEFRSGTNEQRLAFKLHYNLIEKLTINKCQ